MKFQALTSRQKEQIRAELERLLQSPFFVNTRQCQAFLKAVVGHTLNGNEAALRERSLGAELFAREAEYDNTADPIVRVRANEVRKRLGQYYSELQGNPAVRIELPSGAYRAEFTWAAQSSVAIRRRKKVVAAIIAAAVLLLCGAAWWARSGSSAPDPLAQFWAPAIENAKPVMVCSAHPVVYLLAQSVHEAYRAEKSIDPLLGPYVIRLDPDAPLRGRDIVPIDDQFLTIGDAQTAAGLAATFTAFRKPYYLRFGKEISFADLRSSPAVLIGAFSNRWTLQVMTDLPFTVTMREGRKCIQDKAHPTKSWCPATMPPTGKVPDDYALISRTFHPKTGQFTVGLAGITQYGTRSAGELITDPLRFAQIAARLPAGWARKNLQLLIHTKIVDLTPEPPALVEARVF